MRKTLFLSSVLCFMSALSYGTSTWDGHAQDSHNAVTGDDGSKSTVRVFYVRNPSNGQEFHLTTDEAKFDISPDETTVTATVASVVSTAEGADFYISPNGWDYTRSFASLTITEATVNKANLQVYNSPEGGTINAAINKINGTLGSVNNNGTLSIGTAGADATTTNLCGTITNSGTMTLNGAFSFDISDLSHYTMLDPGSMAAPAAGTNGFESGTAIYALVNGLSNLDKTNATFSTTSSDTISVTDTAVTVQKSGNSEHYYIQDGNTVQLSDIKAQGPVNAVTVSNGTLAINESGMGLQQVDGSGNVILSVASTLTGDAASAATGTLTVQGVQLNIGGGDAQTSSIASFSSVVLDGGTLYYNNMQDTLHDLSVAAGKTGVIYSFDMGRASDGAALNLAGTTTVNGELTIQSRWNAQFAIADLTGSGTLNIKGTDGGATSDEAAVYTMGLDNFTGTLAIGNSNATVKRIFDSLESMGAATTNFTVTGGTVTNLCTAGLSSGEVSLGDISGEISGTISGGTINGGTGEVNLSGQVTGGTINGNNHITLSWQITGGTINDATLNTNNVTGGTLNNVTLAANERLNIHGGASSPVTLGNVTHATTGGTNSYAAIITNSSELIINGQADFTTNSYNKIGIEEGSSLTADNGGVVTTGVLGWTTSSVHGSVQVNAGGQLTVEGSAYVKSFTNAGTATIQETLNAATVTNSGTLTVANLDNLNDRANVILNGGSLTVTGTASIASLTMGGGGITVGENHSGTLSVSTLNVNTNSGINANLVMADNGTMAFTNGAVVTMGCTVTIGNNEVLTLADPLTTAPVTLFTGVDGLTLGGTEITEMGWYDANGIFASINGTNITEDGQYFIGYRDGDVSVATAALIPEPATATLSLLALAGLCARRRRK